MDKLPTQDQMCGFKEPGKYISNIYRRLFGIVVYKSWGEIFELDVLLSVCEFSTIVELGTGFGATAAFLGTHSVISGADVYTYDNSPMVTDKVQNLFNRIGVKYEVLDIFENEEKIANLIQRDGRTLLYCDNGDKVREMKLWGKYLKKDDVVLIHDYPEEVPQRAIDETCEMHGLIPFVEDWHKGHVTSHRAMIKE